MKIVCLLYIILLLQVGCKTSNTELYYFQFEKILRAKSWKEIGIKIPQDKLFRNGLSPYDELEIFDGKKVEYLHYIQVYSDSIVAIYDINNSGCMKVIPDSKINNDTLLLSYQLTGDGCKEEEVYRLKYVIKKAGQFKFIRFSDTLFRL